MVWAGPLSLAAAIGPPIWHGELPPYNPQPPTETLLEREGGGVGPDRETIRAALLVHTCRQLQLLFGQVVIHLKDSSFIKRRQAKRR